LRGVEVEAAVGVGAAEAGVVALLKQLR